MSMISAAGFLGKPGMVIMEPHMGTMNPAPAESRTSRTVILYPLGLPFLAGSSEMDSYVHIIV